MLGEPGNGELYRALWSDEGNGDLYGELDLRDLYVQAVCCLICTLDVCNRCASRGSVARGVLVHMC